MALINELEKMCVSAKALSANSGVANCGDSSTEFTHLLLFSLQVDPQDLLLKSKLESLRTVQELVAFYFETRKWDSVLNQLLSDLMKEANGEQFAKSLSKSRSFRDAGNKAIAQRRYKDAVNCYNEALIVTPRDSSDLALCFNSRSIAFFNLKRFSDAALDAEEAIKLNYPEDKKTNVLVRMSKSLAFSGQQKAALPVLEEMKKLDSNAAEKLQKVLEDKKSYPPDLGPKKTVASRCFEAAFKRSKLLPDASSSVVMSYEEGKGRSLRAVRKMAKGDIISREEHFIGLTLAAFHDHNCYACYATLEERFFPCRTCVFAKFCSSSCCQMYQEEHKSECEAMPFLRFYPFGQSVLRALLKSKQLDRECDAVEPEKWPQHEYASNYRSFESLPGHMESAPLGKLYLLIGAVFTAKLALKLQLFKKDERSLIEHVFRVLLIIRCSQNGLHLMNEDDDGQLKESGLTFGRATNCTLALLNHSCAPNARFVTHGRVCCVTATKAIAKGEEITHSYLPFEGLLLTRDQRRDLLKKRNFFCLCERCLKDL